jgi:hypothetical protein
MVLRTRAWGSSCIPLSRGKALVCDGETLVAWKARSGPFQDQQPLDSGRDSKASCSSYTQNFNERHAGFSIVRRFQILKIKRKKLFYVACSWKQHAIYLSTLDVFVKSYSSLCDDFKVGFAQTYAPLQPASLRSNGKVWHGRIILWDACLLPRAGGWESQSKAGRRGC